MYLSALFILDKKDMRNFASRFTVECTRYAKLDVHLKANPARTPHTKIPFHSDCVHMSTVKAPRAPS